jgi:hypothetical protein
MADDWMRPITKPLPGPVSSEDRQLSVGDRERLVLIADHFDGAHAFVAVPACPECVGRPR